MVRQVICAVLAVAVCLAVVGVMKADEATVVSFEKGKLVVKIGDKETTIETKGVKFTGADGTKIKAKDLAEAMKKDVKVDVTKEGDKVVEVKVVK